MSALKALIGILATAQPGSGGGSGLSGTTLNPSDKGTAGGGFVITLSGGNLIASMGGGGAGQVRATNPLSNGKWYFECTFESCGGQSGTSNATVGVGLANVSEDMNQTLGNVNFGSSHNSVGTYNDKGIYIENSSTVANNTNPDVDGDTIACAVDIDAALVWFRNNTQDSVWNVGNAGANPSTRVGGLDISGLGGSGTPLYPTCGFMFRGSTSGLMEINFGDTLFDGVIPSGFHAWDSPL